MTIRQLKKQIRQLDERVVCERFFLNNYFTNTIAPILTQIQKLQILASSLLLIYCFKKEKGKRNIFNIIKIGKNIFLMYLFFKKRGQEKLA